MPRENTMLILIFMADTGAKKVTGGVAVAFAVFYEQYLPKIYRYMNYRVTDKYLAEDLTSIVFEKALTKFQQYNSEKAAISTWVFRIARNTLIDHFRVRGREQTVPLDAAFDKPEDDKSPEQTVIEEEESQILKRCISKLSPHEQEIVTLKFSADMTNRQIADLLGLSESNVGVILYRTVRKLRNDFEGWRNG
jgi:RNA polymerase sigma-70 factor (ECF subfamily)